MVTAAAHHVHGKSAKSSGWKNVTTASTSWICPAPMKAHERFHAPKARKASESAAALIIQFCSLTCGCTEL